MLVAGPLTFAALVALGVLLGFVALWRLLTPKDLVEERLKQYGVAARKLTSVDSDATALLRRPGLSGIDRLLAGFGLGPGLATALAQADIPMTAAEFALLVLAIALSALVLGTLWQGLLVGILLALLLAALPLSYVNWRRGRRQRAFSEQLPELLTLLVGALRSGYGMTQALEVVSDQLASPMADEIQRVIRAVGLGLAVQRALADMAMRVGTEEVDMVVTAINVQYETGGNLATTLETIGETVRDRLRIKREIRVLTAQQRLTGYILAILPIAMVILLYLLNPTYIGRLFEPGWIRLLPVMAVLLQAMGFLIIRRIVDIDV